jgi:hypothetical protein
VVLNIIKWHGYPPKNSGYSEVKRSETPEVALKKNDVALT